MIRCGLGTLGAYDSSGHPSSWSRNPVVRPARSGWRPRPRAVVLTVAELTLDDQPDAVPHARWLARRALDGEVSDDVVADTELVVTELVTNAALHGRPPITVRVLLGGCVRVEVGDAGRFAPVMVGRNVDAMTGRGLSLVAALASDWGIEVLPEGGKLVWVEMERVASVPVPRVEPVIDVGAFLEAWAGDEEVPAR